MGFYRGPHIITDGLVLALDAGNTKSYPGSGTTWTDKSGFENNGTLINGPTFNSSNLGSIVFDGVDDYVNCGNRTSLNFERNNSFSFSFWIYPISTANSGGIASKYDISNKGWTVGTFNGHISLVLRNTLTTNDIVVATANNTVLINNWYFVTVTYNGNSNATGVSFYINGIKTLNDVITRNALTADISNTANFEIGGRTLVNQVYYTGRISIFSTYNRELTSQEIQQNYNATKSRYGL